MPVVVDRFFESTNTRQPKYDPQTHKQQTFEKPWPASIALRMRSFGMLLDLARDTCKLNARLLCCCCCFLYCLSSVKQRENKRTQPARHSVALASVERAHTIIYRQVGSASIARRRRNGGRDLCEQFVALAVVDCLVVLDCRPVYTQIESCLKRANTLALRERAHHFEWPAASRADEWIAFATARDVITDENLRNASMFGWCCCGNSHVERETVNKSARSKALGKKKTFSTLVNAFGSRSKWIFNSQSFASILSKVIVVNWID